MPRPTTLFIGRLKGIFVPEESFRACPVGPHGDDKAATGTQPFTEADGDQRLAGSGQAGQNDERLCGQTDHKRGSYLVVTASEVNVTACESASEPVTYCSQIRKRRRKARSRCADKLRQIAVGLFHDRHTPVGLFAHSAGYGLIPGYGNDVADVLPVPPIARFLNPATGQHG